MGAGRGQVVGAARCRVGETQGCAVRAGDDLDVHPVLLVFLAVIRLVRSDAFGGDQGAVDNDEVALAQADQGLVQAGCPGGEDLERLVDVAPGGRGRDTEARQEDRPLVSSIADSPERLTAIATCQTVSDRSHRNTYLTSTGPPLTCSERTSRGPTR